MKAPIDIAQHRIYQGDIIQVLEQHVENNSVHLIFLDPPYNIGKAFGQCKDRWSSEEAYLNWCYAWLELCLKKLHPHGSLYLMGATQFMPYFDLYVRKHLHILSRIVWAYDSAGVQAKKRFGSLYEPILHAVNHKKNYTFNAHDIQIEAPTGARRKLIDYRRNPPVEYSHTKTPGNVWNFPRVRYRMKEYEKHPSQKPEALLERIVRASSHPGELVLDPFAGTFTTAAVCARLERRSISIEQEDRYVTLGEQRIREALTPRDL